MIVRGGLICLALALAATNAPAQIPAFEQDLHAGRTAEAEARLKAELKARPDDNTRFALGAVQFLRAVEKRAQGLYRHGYRSEASVFTNLPIPANNRPEPLDAKTLRGMLAEWVEDLAQAEATLAAIQSEDAVFKINFGKIRIDLTGDPKNPGVESLMAIYRRFNRAERTTDAQAAELVIRFDRADVDWLRGYCHLLMAFSESILAYDFNELARESAYLVFSGAKPPAKFIEQEDPKGNDWGPIFDAVAAIHLMRLPLAEPNRLKSVLGHLEQTVALSRSSWKRILAETDNDLEWIPSPKQQSAVSSVRVSQEMVDGWHGFLDEFESILQGKTLIPFWRGKPKTLGINVRRVLLEPREFDLVLWVRGTAAVPYLEEGRLSQPETWSRFNRIFQGEFIGFAIWFN